MAISTLLIRRCVCKAQMTKKMKKTTTLRMLLGLIRPTGDGCSVLGLEPGMPASPTPV